MNKVLLVEGDSDRAFFEQVCKTLDAVPTMCCRKNLNIQFFR